MNSNYQPAWSVFVRLILIATLLSASSTILTPPRIVHAATIIVNTNVDENDGSCNNGDCSLRDAIQIATAGDTITFDTGLTGQTITITDRRFSITKNLIIDGSTLATPVIISGNGNTSIFSISSGSTVTFNHLKIIDGFARSGSGIYNSGSLTILNSTISGNKAIDSGAGILNSGTLTIANSTLVNNQTYFDNGGGILNTGSLMLTNSTLVSNKSGANGGGIYNTGSMTMTNVTVSGNTTYGSGGIYNETGSTMSFRNTIIANNIRTTSGTSADCVTVSTNSITENLNNLVEDGTCSTNGSYFLSGDPLLDVLANNGGSTQTLALLLHSKAIDTGNLGVCPTTDQRGRIRPQNAGCDIGSVEKGLLNLTISVSPIANIPYHSIVTYTFVLTNINSETVTDVSLMDILPEHVAFNNWVEGYNHGATISNGVINWSGNIAAFSELKFKFSVTHTGTYSEIVQNIVEVNYAGQTLSKTSTFSVECLPAAIVMNNADSGIGSLRQAIKEVCSDGDITFNEDTNIALDKQNGRLIIDKPIRIDGENNIVIISGNNETGVFEINTSTNVTVILDHLNIGNGYAANGGGIINNGLLLLLNSTLYANTSTSDGGGIYNNGELYLQNSTLFSNTAISDGGGVYNTDTLTMFNNTISNNKANNRGGGIYNESDSTLHFGNTIIANSTMSDGETVADCEMSSYSSILENFNNLVEDGTCSNGGNNFLTGDPLLEPLADNGGPTQTLSLFPNSPAIDAGNMFRCPMTDQRGVTRPQNKGCDIGAVEADQFPLTLTNSVSPETNVPYHGDVIYTIVLANTDTEAITGINLTDILPAQITFKNWVEGYVHGATVFNNVINWSGDIAATSELTFKFVVIHTGIYAETVENIVVVDSSEQTLQQTSAFTVECLPAISVTNSLDNGAGSLRLAIKEVCTNGNITFDHDISITLEESSGELIIDKSMTIDGKEHTITLSGNNVTGVFNINYKAVDVIFNHLKIINGNATNGGGIHINNGTLTLNNSTLSGNTASNIGGGINNNGGSLNINNSTITDNSATSGGGIYSYTTSGSFSITDSTISGNMASNYIGGGIFNSGAIAAIHNCIISNNESRFAGGGISNTDSGTILMTNSTLTGNSAFSGAGGILSQNGCTVTIINSILSGNSAGKDSGGGIINGGLLTVTNSTFYNNSAAKGGGGISNSNVLNFRNSIIANNTGGDCSNTGTIAENINNLVRDDSCKSDNRINFLNGDPFFADVVNGHLHLRYDSPAVDSGDNDSNTTTTDRDDLNRVVGNTVDRGAYEFQAYTLTVNKVGQGTIAKTPNWTAYTNLDQVELSAIAEDGWSFAGWSEDLIGNETRMMASITKNMAVTAIFTKNNDTPIITEGDNINVGMSEDGSPNAFNLILHATDVDLDDTLIWNIASKASHGSAAASGTGASIVISYSPDTNYSGADSFIVQVSDSNGGIDSIIVNVTTNTVNDSPIITEGDTTSVTMLENGTSPAFDLILHATDIDSSILTWSIVTPASHGNASTSGTGAFIVIHYTPNVAYIGTDSFVVQVSDGDNGTDNITVNVTIVSTQKVYLPLLVK